MCTGVLNKVNKKSVRLEFTHCTWIIVCNVCCSNMGYKIPWLIYSGNVMRGHFFLKLSTNADCVEHTLRGNDFIE